MDRMTAECKFVLTGSPHSDGATEHIAKRLFPEVEMIRLYQAGIEPCRGCRSCSVSCIIHDEFEKILNSCKPHFVLISPIYFYGFPSFVKAFVDRFQIFWNSKRRENFESAVIILHGESGNKKAEAGLKAVSEMLFNFLGAKKTFFTVLHKLKELNSIKTEKRLLCLEKMLHTVYSAK